MGEQSAGERPVVPEVTPGEAKARQDQGTVLVDVRNLDEWQEGHIRGAVHIALGDLPRRLHELDPHQAIITVCRSGNRSAFAADVLLKAGFPSVHNMVGGTLAWTEVGLPISS